MLFYIFVINVFFILTDMRLNIIIIKGWRTHKETYQRSH